MKMTYRYECDGCSEITEKEQSIKDPIIREITCPKCGQIAKKKFEMGMLLIPESFKATSELYNSDDLSNPRILGERLNRTRPSGKSRTLY